MADTKKCAHDRCTCMVGDGSKYCCKACEDAAAAEDTTIACDCPHAGCGGKL